MTSSLVEPGVAPAVSPVPDAPREDRPRRSRAAEWVVLLAIVACGAGLRLWDFGRVPGTPFYDAAVRSMGLSWHNAFFGAIEPGGQVSIDKTPVDLWLQVASTKLFGFTGTSIRLPETLIGIAAIPLLHAVVRRGCGVAAGLSAAAALAVLPVSVLTSRSDTMDTVMGTLLLAAIWVVVRSDPRRRGRAVVVSGALAGLAFEVKLFQCVVGLPALAVLWAMALDGGPWRRMRAVLAGGASFVIVAAAWPVVASLAPGVHPFPLGSTDGSIASVILDYNGLDRIGAPQSGSSVKNLSALLRPEHARHLARLVGVELVLALGLGLVALVTVGLRSSERRTAAPGDASSWNTGAGSPGPPAVPGTAPAGPASLVVVALAVWLATGLIVFGTTGQLRPRYLEAFSPAIAGTIGVAVGVLARAAATDRRRAATTLVAAAVVAGAAAPIMRIGSGVPAIVAVVLAAAAAAAAGAAAAWPRRALRSTVRTGVVAVSVLLLGVAGLAVPAVQSARFVRAGAADSGTAGRMTSEVRGRLSAYLIAHQGRARYEVAASGITPVAPVIVSDARPVLVLASIGNRPLVSTRRLRSDVLAGRVRFVLAGTGPGKLATVDWARRYGTDVSAAAGLGHGLRLFRVEDRPHDAAGRPSSRGRSTRHPRRRASARGGRAG